MSSRPGGSHGHVSRRDNPSTSSSGHSSGRSRAVESAVTRLLVSIKALLEALTNWSQLKINENQVSDVYVRLGNDFNVAVAAFAAFSIDMTELMSVPGDLRNVLEQCLAEDATPDNLEIYLPTVRSIITNLLQGLREKQAIYARIVRRGSEQSGHERTDSRSSRSEQSSRRADGTHRSQGSRTIAEGERLDRDSTPSRRNGHLSGRRRDDIPQSIPEPDDDERFVGGFVPSQHEQQRSSSPSYEEEDTAVPSDPPAHNQHQRHPPSDDISRSQAPQHLLSERSLNQPFDYPQNPPAPSAVPANVKRYSLIDKPTPASPPTVVVEPSSPNSIDQQSASPPAPEIPPEVPAAMANSLAALKKSDVLERRASKRFSTFNISKMTGSSMPRERSMRTNPNRRSLAVSSTLTPGELAVLTEVDEEGPYPISPSRHEGGARSRSISRTATPERKQDTPPVPKLPQVRTPEPPSATEPNERESVPNQPTEVLAELSCITVFLQVGREVKKAVVDQNLSFASLRVLFVDKFSYNPGQDNFPAIYIRDPSSGVQYELEDTGEVKEKCLLSLNIEPLDQIKQHIDSQISSLSNDIKELKTAVAASGRPMAFPSIVEPQAESTPLPNRPSDHQLQYVARRLSRFVTNLSPFTPQATSSAGPSSYIQPQTTGGSTMTDYSTRVVSDLKIQFDEVQNLRRDLGVMRQLYTEFMKQTQESLGTLRAQTKTVKQLANTNVGGARAYIGSGKKKLDTRSQNVLTDVEKLLDTLENLKDDVTKRQVTPKDHLVKGIKKDIESTATELESLKEHIKTIKPMWKTTWEEELQNIVEEQQFLTHQEEFLNDLLEDHKAAVEVYGHIEKVVSLRGLGNGKGRPTPRNRSFKSSLPEEGPVGVNNVMLEIRGAAIDPVKRMKAIEVSMKNRQKELAARSDELQAELTEFVGGKKLKMTGGAEEADRVRQKRSDATLRAMFNGTYTSPPPGMPSPPLPS